MRLADYLNTFGWSQVDLAREAEISTQTVARALSGKTISRRNAARIATALNKKWQDQGSKGNITLASIRGLQIAALQRKRLKVLPKMDSAERQQPEWPQRFSNVDP